MKQELKSIEQHAEALGTPAWAFAATKAHKGWPALLEVTEREYREALEAALSAPMDGSKPTPEGVAEAPKGGEA